MPGVSHMMLTFDQLLKVANQSSLYSDWPLFGPIPLSGIDDLRWNSLPTINSQNLSNHNNYNSHALGGVRQFLSSGTKGTPKIVPFSDADLLRVASLCGRFSALEGITTETRSMVLLPMASWTVGRITMDGHRMAGAQVHGVDLHGGVEAWQQACHAIRPTVISSTPSVLSAWAPYYDGPSLSLVETTGEPLLESERRIIESSFGAFVHDAYGLTECVVGVECGIRHGFHYWPDSVHVEILAPDTDCPLPLGALGEIVLTSFQQASLPILRYRSGDLGYLATLPCPCGRQQPILHLYGRKENTMALPRGVSLDRIVLEEAIVAWGFDQPKVVWKGMPGSPAAPFVTDSFKPTLELSWATEKDREEISCIQYRLFSTFPEIAELVHEDAIQLFLLGKGEEHVR